MRRIRNSIFFSVIWSGFICPAFAVPSHVAVAGAADPAALSAANEAGARAFAAGRWPEVLAAGRHAFAAGGGAGALETIAVAALRLGQVSLGADAYEAIVADEAATPKARERARNQLRALDSQVGRVQVESAVIGATVLLDGIAAGVTPLASPLRALPGKVVVSVKLPDGSVVNSPVVVKRGQSVRVDVAPAAPAAAALAPSLGVPAPPPVAPSPASPTSAAAPASAAAVSASMPASTAPPAAPSATPSLAPRSEPKTPVADWQSPKIIAGLLDTESALVVVRVANTSAAPVFIQWENALLRWPSGRESPLKTVESSQPIAVLLPGGTVEYHMKPGEYYVPTETTRGRDANQRTPLSDGRQAIEDGEATVTVMLPVAGSGCVHFGRPRGEYAKCEAFRVLKEPAVR